MIFGLLKPDGAVPKEQLPGSDRSGTGSPAIRTRPRCAGILSLLGGCLLGAPSGDLAADLVGTLLDGREIKLMDLFIGPEDLAADLGEKPLELGVERFAVGGLAEHRGPP